MGREFKLRYVILNPKNMHGAGEDLKAGAKLILEEHESLNDKWRLGHTKVFFRAGTIGILEEIRDEKIKSIVNVIQALCRRYIGIKSYKHEVLKKDMIPVMQR